MEFTWCDFSGSNIIINFLLQHHAFLHRGHFCEKTKTNNILRKENFLPLSTSLLSQWYIAILQCVLGVSSFLCVNTSTVCTGCKLVSMCEHIYSDLWPLKCYASSLFPSLIFTSIVFFWTQAFISRKFTRRFLHGCGIFLDLFLIMICCFYFYATTMGPVTIDNCKVVT